MAWSDAMRLSFLTVERIPYSVTVDVVNNKTESDLAVCLIPTQFEFIASLDLCVKFRTMIRRVALSKS